MFDTPHFDLLKVLILLTSNHSFHGWFNTVGKKLNKNFDSVNTEFLDGFIEDITNLINGNVGQTRLNFKVGDLEEGNFVELHSNKFKVDLNNEFLDSLDQIPGIEYKLN